MVVFVLPQGNAAKGFAHGVHLPKGSGCYVVRSEFFCSINQNRK